MADIDINKEINSIKETENKILKHQEASGKRDKITKFIFVGIIVLLAGIIIYQAVSYQTNMFESLKVQTEIKDRFIWADMPEAERKEKYRKFMMRVFVVYGNRYYPHKKKALHPFEQADRVFGVVLPPVGAHRITGTGGVGGQVGFESFILGLRWLEIAGQNVEEQTVIGGTLHVALTPQGVDAAAGSPDIAQ